MKFYDTCALLKLQDKAFSEPFAISSVTIHELDNIKENRAKDPSVKYAARNVSRLLKSHIGKFKTVRYNKAMMPSELDDEPDNKIIACANTIDGVKFITDDANCFLTATEVFGLDAELVEDEDDDYTGFIKLTFNDDELADFYSNPHINKWDVLQNQYVVINNGIDVRKWNGSEFVALKEKIPKTLQFGIIKSKDVYQRMAIDSMYTNRLTMIKGRAGTGKTLLALATLCAMLEKHDIDKVIVFCNPVATAYSAKLGYYPGDRNSKLLDSTIGSILSSKLGDQQGVIRYIEDEKLQLLPFSDMRGFDTNGMKAGVLIEEAENLDISLMKLALQRLGSDSRCIIDGDYEAQVDLEQYAGANNGMHRASKVFRGKQCYGEVELQKIYRSDIAEIAEEM